MRESTYYQPATQDIQLMSQEQLTLRNEESFVEDEEPLIAPS